MYGKRIHDPSLIDSYETDTAILGITENRPAAIYDVFKFANSRGLLFKDYTDPYMDLEFPMFPEKNR